MHMHPIIDTEAVCCEKTDENFPEDNDATAV